MPPTRLVQRWAVPIPNAKRTAAKRGGARSVTSNVPWNNYGYYPPEYGVENHPSTVYWGAGETIQDESGLVYYIESDKAIIQKYNGTNADVIIPDVYNSVPVVAIEAYAFYENLNVRSVTIGSNIQSIGSYAFSGCANLESFNFTGSDQVV